MGDDRGDIEEMRGSALEVSSGGTQPNAQEAERPILEGVPRRTGCGAASPVNGDITA